MMLTLFDKAIAAMLPGALLWLNQKYGFHFDTSPENMAALASFLGAVLVYFVPNKPAATGGPSGKNFGVGAAILLAFFIVSPQGAHAQTGTPCTLSACTGWYVGGNFSGAGSNIDFLSNGLNGSVLSNGAMMGVQGGYQYWAGGMFFGAELAAEYEFGAASPLNAYRFIQVAKIGGSLTALFNSGPSPVAVPSGLQAAFIAPYIQAGGIEAPWGNGTVIGAGAVFRIADNINLDVSYLAAKYQGATVNNENIIKIGISRKF